MAVNGDTAFSTIGASTDGPDEPTACSFPPDLYTGIESDIWYRYTATCTGNLTVDLRDSDFDTRVAVYSRASLPDAPAPASSTLASASAACWPALPVSAGSCATMQAAGADRWIDRPAMYRGAEPRRRAPDRSGSERGEACGAAACAVMCLRQRGGSDHEQDQRQVGQRCLPAAAGAGDHAAASSAATGGPAAGQFGGDLGSEPVDQPVALGSSPARPARSPAPAARAAGWRAAGRKAWSAPPSHIAPAKAPRASPSAGQLAERDQRTGEAEHRRELCRLGQGAHRACRSRRVRRLLVRLVRVSTRRAERRPISASVPRRTRGRQSGGAGRACRPSGGSRGPARQALPGKVGVEAGPPELRQRCERHGRNRGCRSAASRQRSAADDDRGGCGVEQVCEIHGGNASFLLTRTARMQRNSAGGGHLPKAAGACRRRARAARDNSAANAIWHGAC